MSGDINLSRIRSVHQALGDLQNEVVYVGGATVAMYKDRPASESRVTDDVDMVIELASYSAYSIIEEKLRQRGFENDIHSKVICRYKIHGVKVDIMPTSENVLGFKNRWYQEGFKHAIDYSIDESVKVRIFTPVYFLASKLDAFNDRGKNDGRSSPDFEDIVYILNNRNAIWDEMDLAHDEVKSYLRQEFSKLLANEYLEEWISAHLDYAEQGRVRFILGGLSSFIAYKEN